MISYKDRVEFGSTQWLATARAVLAREISDAHLRPDQEFSLCEAFSGAPAHLGLPGDVASWHIKFANGELTITEGEADGVDLKITGDYHCILPLAMTVYIDPAAKHRAKRENTHRVGPDATVRKGELADQSVLDVLTRFHNEMARRTLDNPDLETRIAGHNLQRHATQLQEQGYTILENAITAAFADELRHEILELVTEGPDDSMLTAGQAARLLARGRLFEEAALHPWVLALVERRCGKLFRLAQSLATVRTTGGSTPLHDDIILMEEPFPSYSMATTCIWALDDLDEGAGPALVLPGSDTKRHYPPNNYAGDPSEYPVEQILMPKGSIAIWDSATWHAAKPRTAAGQRVALHNYFCCIFVQPLDDDSP